MIIDTHCHMYLPDFEVDKTEMMERAKKARVFKMLLPAIDSETHEAMLMLEKSNSTICYAMMGLHPCSVKDDFKNELKIIEEYLNARKFIAVGEIGLDFHWDVTFSNQQYEAFRQQVQWALDFDIPIVIHSRKATDECIEVVKEFQKGKLKGVFHCFSGDKDQAKQLVDLGFYLGIGGVLTFKNSGLDKAIENISIDKMILETDAPYLAPVPFRGKRNEPSYIAYVADKLSQLKNITKKEVESITTQNAVDLFGI